MVTGVEGKETTIAGQGTVELISMCNGQEYILTLADVLHVPNNQNNLILLGCWDAAGGWYISGEGVIILVTKDGKCVAFGKKINNYLYKMNIVV
jgi:hypothetical protein